MKKIFQTAEEDFEIRNVFRDSIERQGYREVQLPVLEPYETYETLQTVRSRKSLLKLIAQSGDILVLRPDVTIPLMRKLARNDERLEEEVRCWYVQSVFRQTEDTAAPVERRQAGIELFGQPSVNHDAEVIALACLSLVELGISDFKIELGHAGIIQEMNRMLRLTEEHQLRVNSLIQTKNNSELADFLIEHQIDEQTGQLLSRLVFSYGKPESVLRNMREVTVSEAISSILDHIQNVWERIVELGYGDHITVDLGMINDMDYYSGIQFQGFSRAVGQPLLMGGRYDEVSRNFGAELPAVGFACNVEALFAAKRNSD